MSNPLLQLRLAYLRMIAKAWKDKSYRDCLLKGCDITPELQKLGFPEPSPWPSLEFKLVCDELDQWLPHRTSGWIGGNKDRFKIKLPERPEYVTQPEALAGYYQKFPTFFGPPPPSRSPEPLEVLPEDLGVGPEKFLEFGGVVLRAIALGWIDPEFHMAIEKDGISALEVWLGFNNPWNFAIDFEWSKNFSWDPETAALIHWDKNIVKVSFPNPPEGEDKWFQAIALTSYNNTGPQYPFTCE